MLIALYDPQSNPKRNMGDSFPDGGECILIFRKGLLRFIPLVNDAIVSESLTSIALYAMDREDLLSFSLNWYEVPDWHDGKYLKVVNVGGFGGGRIVFERDTPLWSTAVQRVLNPRSAPASDHPHLSRWEQEIRGMLAEGYGTELIGNLWHIVPRLTHREE